MCSETSDGDSTNRVERQTELPELCSATMLSEDGARTGQLHRRCPIIQIEKCKMKSANHF